MPEALALRLFCHSLLTTAGHALEHQHGCDGCDRLLPPAAFLRVLQQASVCDMALAPAKMKGLHQNPMAIAT